MSILLINKKITIHPYGSHKLKLSTIFYMQSQLLPVSDKTQSHHVILNTFFYNIIIPLRSH